MQYTRIFIQGAYPIATILHTISILNKAKKVKLHACILKGPSINKKTVAPCRLYRYSTHKYIVTTLISHLYFGPSFLV